MQNFNKRVLIICPFATPNIGGVESHLDKLMDYICIKGGYPILITYQPLMTPTKGVYHEKTDKKEVIRLQWFGRGLFNKLENYFIFEFIYLFPGLFLGSLYYYLKHHREIDVIHAHGLVCSVITSFLSIIHKKRIVLSTHAVYNFEKRKFLSLVVKIILRTFDQILAVSEVSRNELIKLGLDESKIKVHPNWINTNLFNDSGREIAKKNLNLTYELNVLLGVGRLIEKKGVKLFLEAMTNMPNIGFHIVGGGELEGEVKSYASKYSNLKFYGILMQNNTFDNAKLVDLYKACDYLISPYLYDEGFSTTLLESLACGTPLIITQRGSPPTFLDDSVVTYIPYNPSALDIVHTIEKLSANVDSLIHTRNRCREFAVKNFGLQNADIILKSYSE